MGCSCQHPCICVHNVVNEEPRDHSLSPHFILRFIFVLCACVFECMHVYVLNGFLVPLELRRHQMLLEPELQLSPPSHLFSRPPFNVAFAPCPAGTPWGNASSSEWKLLSEELHTGSPLVTQTSYHLLSELTTFPRYCTLLRRAGCSRGAGWKTVVQCTRDTH